MELAILHNSGCIGIKNNYWSHHSMYFRIIISLNDVCLRFSVVLVFTNLKNMILITIIKLHFQCFKQPKRIILPLCINMNQREMVHYLSIFVDGS